MAVLMGSFSHTTRCLTNKNRGHPPNLWLAYSHWSNMIIVKKCDLCVDNVDTFLNDSEMHVVLQIKSPKNVSSPWHMACLKLIKSLCSLFTCVYGVTCGAFCLCTSDLLAGILFCSTKLVGPKLININNKNDWRLHGQLKIKLAPSPKNC